MNQAPGRIVHNHVVRWMIVEEDNMPVPRVREGAAVLDRCSFVELAPARNRSVPKSTVPENWQASGLHVRKSAGG